jgi:hypothetical protein
VPKPTRITIETGDVGLYNEVVSLRDLDIFRLGARKWFVERSTLSMNTQTGEFEGVVVLCRVEEIVKGD